MGLVLIIVFLPSLFAWCKSVYVLSKFKLLNLQIVLTGICFAIGGVIWPLVMWNTTGSIYSFGPPFVYLLFSVLAPYSFAESITSSNEAKNQGFALILSYSLFLSVSLVFPFICTYFFFAPDKMSVAALLGLKSYH